MQTITFQTIQAHLDHLDTSLPGHYHEYWNAGYGFGLDEGSEMSLR